MIATKSIVITEDEKGNINFTCVGFNSFEAMGVLRSYEKEIWLKVQTQNNKTKEEK